MLIDNEACCTTGRVSLLFHRVKGQKVGVDPIAQDGQFWYPIPSSKICVIARYNDVSRFGI